MTFNVGDKVVLNEKAIEVLNVCCNFVKIAISKYTQQGYLTVSYSFEDSTFAFEENDNCRHSFPKGSIKLYEKEENKMELKSIKAVNLKEARKQYLQEKKNAEVEYAKARKLYYQISFMILQNKFMSGEKKQEFNGLTKYEISCIKKFYPACSFKKYNWGELINKEISEVIYVVHNPSKKHESGYPFIRFFGKDRNENLIIDMGWHDHFIIEKPTNTDAIGKNIFRMMTWTTMNGWKIENANWCSTLQLKDDEVWR